MSSKDTITPPKDLIKNKIIGKTTNYPSRTPGDGSPSPGYNLSRLYNPRYGNPYLDNPPKG